MARMLAATSGPSYRLQATNAPFDAKDKLKARAYRWNADERVWHTRLETEEALQAECEWLKLHVYGQRSAAVQIETMDALVKYSIRKGSVAQKLL
jgi:DNA polymerase-3 subunit epsilon